MLDKIKGGLFGVAIGDALGATTEFMTKDEIEEEYGKVTKIIGGGIWGLKKGETTDDTAMTLAVVKGIMSDSNNPLEEIGKQFLHWQDTDPVDIGITIRAVFENYEGDWFETAEKVHHLLDGKSAGNGTLMRCLPIGLAYSDPQKIDELSIAQSKMTHYDDLASEACVIYNRIASRLFEGVDLKLAIHTEIKNTIYDLDYTEIPNCNPDGYVVNTMKWVLYWLLNSETFEEVVVGATNMGHDSDTVAAIAGGLKGLEVGYNNIPGYLREELKIRQALWDYAEILTEIRNQDTLSIQKQSDQLIEEMLIEAKKIYDQVDEVNLSHIEEIKLNGSSKKKPLSAEINESLEKIRKGIYLFRLSFNENHSDFEIKFETWWGAKMRYQRSQRLLDLGAPLIIIQNEFRWIRIMIDHMHKRHHGIEPHFTEDERQELDELYALEKSFDEDNEN